MRYDPCACGDEHEPYGDMRDVWLREIHGIDESLRELTLREEALYEERMELMQAKHELLLAFNDERG